MHFLALLAVLAAKKNRLDLVYWGIILISFRNLCPLFGINIEIPEDFDYGVEAVRDSFIVVKCYLNCYVVQMCMQPSSYFVSMLIFILTTAGFTLWAYQFGQGEGLISLIIFASI